MKKRTVLLFSALLVSLLANGYLFSLVVSWQDAWTEQMLTTSHVERLYAQSGADVSFDSVRELVGEKLGSYQVVPSEDKNQQWGGLDENSISFQGTKFLFKNGIYIGSKANLPGSLTHWAIGQGYF